MNQLINSITLSAMSNGLYVQFMSDIDFHVKRVTPEALKIKKCYDTFSSYRDLLDNSFLRQMKDNSTAELVNLDNQRNQIYRCITKHVNADISSSDINKQAKAQILQNKINSLGYLPGIGNNDESARMDDLGKDLQASPLKEIVEELGLTEEVKAMIKANTDFIDFSRQRTENRKLIINATKEVRSLLDPAYRDMIAVVNSQITINTLMDKESEGGGGGDDDRPVIESVTDDVSSDPLIDFALSINAVIREYKTKAAQSGTTTPPKEEDDRPVIESE